MKKSRYDTSWKISGLNPLNSSKSRTQGTMSKVSHLFYGFPLMDQLYVRISQEGQLEGPAKPTSFYIPA